MTDAVTAKRRRRMIVRLIAGVLVLGGLVVILGIFFFGGRPKTDRTDFPDYRELVAKYPTTPLLQYPTEEELPRFALLWPTRPPEENALEDYLKAINALATMGPPPGSCASADVYEDDIAPLGKWIEANQAALDGVRLAARRDYFALPVLLDPSSGNPMPDLTFLSNMRQLSRVCLDAGLYAELEGRPDEAAQWYMTCLRMGRQMRGGLLIQDLVSVALTAIGDGPLCKLIENAQLKDETLNSIISFCDEEPAVAEEIAFVLNAEEEWMDAHSGWVSGAATVLGQRRAIRRAREDFAIPLSKLLEDPNARKMLDGGPSPSGIAAGIWRWRGEVARREVRMAALKIRAAIALYRNRNDRLPDALEELVPNILTQVPPDPYTGEPFRYRKDGERWELRSTGPDTKYDNNVPNPFQLKGEFWMHWPDQKGLDYVFVSTLDSNVARRKRENPKADAEWERLNPMPSRPQGLPPLE